LSITTNGGKVMLTGNVPIVNGALNTVVVSTFLRNGTNLSPYSYLSVTVNPFSSSTLENHTISWIDQPASGSYTYALSSIRLSGSDAYAQLAYAPCVIQAVELAP
jgi:hypothetical protein